MLTVLGLDTFGMLGRSGKVALGMCLNVPYWLLLWSRRPVASLFKKRSFLCRIAPKIDRLACNLLTCKGLFSFMARRGWVFTPNPIKFVSGMIYAVQVSGGKLNDRPKSTY